MKWNRGSFRGTGKVFSFTFSQFMKNRGNRITMIIMIILVLFSVPALTFFSGGGIKSPEVSGILHVFWNNETTYSINPAREAAADPFYAETDFEETLFSEGNLSSDHENDSVYVRFAADPDTGGIRIELRYLPEQKPSDQDLTAIEMLMTQAAGRGRMESLQIPEDSQKLVTGQITGQIETQEEYEKGDEISYGIQYGIQLGYSIFVMTVSIFAVTYIIRTVAEEKASRIVETLMVSVQPLALIVGKILAAMVYVFGFILLLAAAAGLSWVVTGRFMDVSAVMNFIRSSGVSLDLFQLGPLTILVILVSLVLGFLTFAILAGVSGAGCSSMEDIQGASTLSTVLIFIGYFAAILLNSARSDSAVLFGSLCPFVSVFCAPVQFMLGKTGIGTILISWLLQATVIVCLAIFSAGIYRALLMYRGSRPGLRQILMMAKQRSSGKEKK